MKLHEIFKPVEHSVLNVMHPQPETVKEFDCAGVKLTSLEGSPSTVLDQFDCQDNELKSFKGGPKTVGGAVVADFNMISSLEGFPKSVGSFVSLEGNELSSLHNIHKFIPKMSGILYLSGNPIRSHVLGLLLIDGITHIVYDGGKIQKIINKHLNDDRDVFACQEELIEAGFEDYAQL